MAQKASRTAHLGGTVTEKNHSAAAAALIAGSSTLRAGRADVFRQRERTKRKRLIRAIVLVASLDAYLWWRYSSGRPLRLPTIPDPPEDPLDHHFDQNFHVRHRLVRYGAGRRMDFERYGPGEIAAAIAEEIGREVAYLPVETGGARRAAEQLAEMLA